MISDSVYEATWMRRLTVVFVCGTLLLLLTSNFSAASAFLSSALVSTQPLASALWVKRHDPWKRRGRICGLFHLSVAVWLGAPAALLTMVVAVFVHKRLGMPLPEREMNATLVALLCAVAGSAIIGMIASLAALIAGVRVWVHPRFAAVLGDELSGNQLCPAANFGLFVLATSLTALVLPILALLLMKPLPLPPILGFLLVPCTIFVVLVPCIWLASRIFAASPREYLMAPASEN